MSTLTPADLTQLCTIRAGLSPCNLTHLEAQGLITHEAGAIRLTEAGHQATAGYLLSREGEQVTGVWQIDRVATAHYASPLIERESVYCSIEEYEAMQE